MDGSPPYRLDIEGLEDPTGNTLNPRSLRGRPWLGIHFECCGAYSRIYRNADGTAYEGRCPHCTAQVRLRVGPGGTDTRFFTAR
ncbi:MAG: hypothetical protein IH989_00470 [Planctomycetes bacterium]|nr:hypothetical protein [Planctomycetota bacterium]